MTCQDSFHEVAFNISFWTRNISSARILFWRGVYREKEGDTYIFDKELFYLLMERIKVLIY